MKTFPDQLADNHVAVGTIITVPDHLACLTPRAFRPHGAFHQHPYSSVTEAYEPTITNVLPLAWTLIGAYAIEPRFHVTFRRKQSTFSFLSRKNGHTQTGESPWELLRGQESEVDPHIVDFQLGGMQINWTADGAPRHYTPDNVAVSVEGLVIAEEIKASASYFLDPDYSALMDLAHTSFSSIGIQFNKVTADQMRHNRRRRYNIATAFDDRFTAFCPAQIAAVEDAFAKDAEGVPLGRLAECLRVPEASALQVVNAMMCTRHLAYDLDSEVVPDTRVHRAPQATKMLPDIRAITLRP